MKVGVFGTGAVGQNIAAKLAELGHEGAASMAVLKAAGDNDLAGKVLLALQTPMFSFKQVR